MLATALFCCMIRFSAEPWEYHSNDAPNAAIFRTLPLDATVPEELTERVTYRGVRRWYTQVRYGASDSTRVVVIVDEVDASDFDLYVDANRDRLIEARDKVAGTGRVRMLPLAAEVVRNNAATRYKRKVILRRALTGASIFIGSSGYMEGTIELGGKVLPARRVDGNANGLFSDPDDRVWIDRDGNGSWDPIAEQFPLTPVLRLSDRRYAVRADAVGLRFGLEEITGEGRIQWKLAGIATSAKVRRLDVMIYGEDGSAYTINDQSESQVLPIGRYALGNVAVSVVDGKTNMPWDFSFSASNQPKRWFEVKRDETLALDPIGTLRFELERVSHADKPCRPGDDVSASPRLYTDAGLLITTSTIGQIDRFGPEGGNCANVSLRASGKILFGSEKSGFS